MTTTTMTMTTMTTEPGAVACSAPTGLGQVGVDVVVDADRGPLVLEVDSHPRPEIQKVTGRGLGTALRNRPVGFGA